MTPNPLRLAIIGAGPAGIFAADLLTKAERDFDLSIDIFEQLPAPYGLVRYGVAPDHPRIKGIVSALREVLEHDHIRLFGNVTYGRDITLDDLKRHYHAVLFATGAIRDASLDIPGIDADGSFGAADFVSWFDGHPDVPRTWPLNAEHVAVIGNGNVALDVSRMLVKRADDLLSTEIPANVYAGLKENPVTDLFLLGRRGPASVKFTPLELRELGEVPGTEIILDERDFAVSDPHAEEEATKNKQMQVISRIFGQWRAKQAERAEQPREQQEPVDGDAPIRRLHMRFWARPVEVVTEEGRVAGLRIERTIPDGQGGVEGTGETEVIPVQAVYRAVGYYGSPVDEIPFDAVRGVIRNDRGRVIDARGEHIEGVYATGWIKRGPVGLIGHTKSDAMETLERLMEDLDRLWTPELSGDSRRDAEAVEELLRERNIPFTTTEGWNLLDEHEISLGELEGRPRIKVVDREDMTRISRAEA